jgi:uncharacterized protein with HEPN domain
VSKAWRPYALHILEMIERIHHIQERGNLTADVILYDAALRNLQTLAEASQRLPPALKARHSDIPWKRIGGFRNILVHNYLGDIDPQTVLGIIRDQLPPLEAAVRSMLSADDPET